MSSMFKYAAQHSCKSFKRPAWRSQPAAASPTARQMFGILSNPYELRSAAALGRFMELGEIAETKRVGKPIPFMGYEGIAEIFPSGHDVQGKPSTATETMPQIYRESTNDAVARATSSGVQRV